MVNWILRWVMSGVALAIVAHLGIGVRYDSVAALATATVVIGLVKSLIRPWVGLLTMPLNCATLGLFGVAYRPWSSKTVIKTREGRRPLGAMQ